MDALFQVLQALDIVMVIIIPDLTLLVNEEELCRMTHGELIGCQEEAVLKQVLHRHYRI